MMIVQQQVSTEESQLLQSRYPKRQQQQRVIGSTALPKTTTTTTMRLSPYGVATVLLAHLLLLATSSTNLVCNVSAFTTPNRNNFGITKVPSIATKAPLNYIQPQHLYSRQTLQGQRQCSSTNKKSTTTSLQSAVSVSTTSSSIKDRDEEQSQSQQQQQIRRRFKPQNLLRRNLRKNINLTDKSSVPNLQRHPPRKVCLMVEPTPFTHVSGYANRFKEMLKFLKQAGDDVNILTVDSHTAESQLPRDYVGYPIQHTLGFTFPLYNHISLTVDLPEMKGARILEQFRPDLIHVTSPGFMVFAALFYARVLRIPLLISYHTHLPTYGRNYLGFIPRVEKTCWDLLRFVHSRADLTLVTSPQMQQELVANGIPRVDVWRKGIDVERFQPKFKSDTMRQRMSNDHPNDFLTVYVGRLGAEKRLKDIKPMLEQLQTKGINVRMCFVGNGPQKGELEQYFQDTNTVFLGQLQGDELSSAFASADVFIMPSDSETLGFVVLESMASGVPVVGAAAGGILDLIHEGIDGYLVTPGDTDTYVAKLQLLAQNKTLRTVMGQQARREAEKWGWEAATSYLRNIQYEKALLNFHSRAFGGFGRPGSAGLWRLIRYRIQGFFRKQRTTRRAIYTAVTTRIQRIVSKVTNPMRRWWNGSGSTSNATTNAV